MTHTRATRQGQRSLCPKDGVETDGDTDKADCITFFAKPAVGTYIGPASHLSVISQDIGVARCNYIILTCLLHYLLSRIALTGGRTDHVLIFDLDL